MQNNLLIEIEERFLASGIVTDDSLLGCTDDEIACLEESFCVKLPQVYKEFLSVFGNSSGDFLLSSKFCYGDLFESRKLAEELLLSAEDPPKLGTLFVFYVRSNRVMYFDTAEESEDPAIYYYQQCRPRPVLKFDSFTSWLRKVVDEEIELFEALKQYKSKKK